MKAIFHLQLIQKRLSFFFLLACLSIFSLPGYAKNTDAPPTINIFRFTANLNIDDNIIAALGDTQSWQMEASSHSYLTPFKGVSWLKIVIRNDAATTQQQLIEIAATVKSLEIYQWHAHADNQLESLSHPSGYKHAFNEREIPYRNTVYSLNIEPYAQNQYFLKIQHDFSQPIDVIAWDDKNLQAAKSRELMLFGMIYGALFMLVIYNFFIYLSSREKNHLFFVLFGGFSGVFITMYEGHFAQFIAPGTPWPKDMFYAMTSAIMCFCFTFYTITFLDLERRSTFFYRLILSSGSIAAITLILLGINDHSIIFSPFTLLIIIALYIPAIAAGFYSRYNGVATAGYFSLAIFLCTLGLSLDVLSTIEYIAWEKWRFSYTSIGYTAMLIVFALALADKMRLLNKEKLATTIELVKITEEQAQSNIEVYKSKLHEVQLEQRADESKIENRAKSEFLATMSHEIRTPMNGILGLTELLKDTTLDPKQGHFVSSITKSAKSLLNVINDLLDYSKIESGTIDLEAKVFNLESIIDDCISISALRSIENKINFIGQIHPATRLQLKGDAPKIRQITLSLLNNAFNHTQGKDIYLNVFETKTKSVNSVEIKIAVDCIDTLLSGEEQHAILSPFNHVTNDKKTKGKELGLSLSLQLVDMMHGKLGIECIEEENLTRFWFTARLLQPHEGEIQALPDRSKNLIGRRLLVCDTNEAFMASVKVLTQSWGMECCTVNNTRDVADSLINDEHAFQVLLIAEELLTPDVQFAIRKSNVAHNFNTSVMLSCRSRFSLSEDEMKKRGIQSILETPHTTAMLYKTLLKSMGIDNKEQVNDEFIRKLSVLVAEDDSVNRLVIEGLLKKLNVCPIIASNGLEAFTQWQQSSDGFDLILMDCEMPEMDGFEATTKIREGEADKGMSSIIVGLSAHSDQEYKTKAYEAGMNDFIVKPLASGEIKELLEHIQAGHFQQKTEDIE